MTEHAEPTCERRIAGTGSRCQRPVDHDGLCYPRKTYPEDN